MPCVAPLRGDGYDHAGSDYALISLTHTWDWTGSPVVALPAGVGARSGLPVGVSLIGRAASDWHLLDIGIQLQARARRSRPRPDLGAQFPRTRESGPARAGNSSPSTRRELPMKWSPTRVDTVPTGAAEESEEARSAQRAGTLVLIARAAAHDRISAALRDARERAELSEQEVVDLLYARGVSISTGDAGALGAHRRHPARGGRRSGRRVPHEPRRAGGAPGLEQPLPRLAGAHTSRLRLAAASAWAFRDAARGAESWVAYLVECRTSASTERSTPGAWPSRCSSRCSARRSCASREVALDPRTRSLTMTARIESARTPQLAAVMAANELLWRTNEYCGDDPAAHVKITHLVSQLAAS